RIRSRLPSAERLPGPTTIQPPTRQQATTHHLTRDRSRQVGPSAERFRLPARLRITAHSTRAWWGRSPSNSRRPDRTMHHSGPGNSPFNRRRLTLVPGSDVSPADLKVGTT